MGRALGGRGDLTLDDVRAALEAGDETARRIVVGAARPLGQVIAAVIGLLNVRRIVLLGSVAELGEPWIAAVRDEAARRSLGLLSEGTTIELGRPREHPVVLGASALLMTRELGLVPVR
jgi:predicted NBD/HSP70 family sugar kinase